MDPDDHEPSGAVVPEGRARRELTALKTRPIFSELSLRVKILLISLPYSTEH